MKICQESSQSWLDMGKKFGFLRQNNKFYCCPWGQEATTALPWR